MAVTRNTYTGNGSTVLYSFTFPYLEATDIKVSVNGTTTTAYTLANATTIQFNTAPANGASIAIYRQTDDTALSAAFYPGSAIRSADLNDNFTQNLYVTQESNRDATDAIGYGQQAISTANGAVSTANAATATANTASSNASAAVATANTASSNASAAVSTANTASSNATSAVNTANAATATANSAAADAATAISTANSAVSTANSAVSTANSAVTTAGNAVTSANSAVSTATTAATNAANAVSTANAANTTSGNALTTANNAVTTANSAVSTANAADTKADQAINAVANALLFDIVANVAAIPASPANQDAVEITNSTGIQSFTPLAGLPAGFVGDAGLSVRLLYQSAGSTWTWLQYFPNDPDNRYAGPNTDAGTAAAPSIAFGPTDPNTGIFSPGADEFGIATGGVGRFFIDAAGNVVVATALSVNGEDVVVDNDARLTDTRTPTDGSVTNAKVDANAAIAGTKISPDFGSQNRTSTGTSTAASFIPSSSTAPTNGVYLPAANTVGISANSVGRVFIDSSGKVSIGTSTASTTAGGLDISSGGIGLVVGADGSASTRTNAADKIFRIGSAHYTNAEEPVCIAFGQNLSSDNELNFGGGSAALNAATYMRFFTAANNTTTGGTERMRLDSSGRLGIGTTAPIAQTHIRLSAVTGYTSPSNDGFVLERGGGNDVAISIATDNTRNGYLIFADGDSANPAWVGYDHSANAMSFRVNASERARIDSSGRLLVGTSSARDNFYNTTGVAPGIQLEGTSFQNRTLSVVSSESGGSGGLLVLAHQKSGTIGGNTVLASGDAMGVIDFQGSDGTEFVQGARIACEVDGTPGANDMPGRLVFSTTSDSSASPSERLRIASTGALGLSGANYGSSGQVLTSQGSGAAPQWATPSSSPLTYISRVDASNATSVSFTSGIDSTYKIYVIQISELYRSGSGEFWLELSTNNGSTWSTTQYYTSNSLATNPGATSRWKTDDFTSNFATDARGACTVYLSNLNTATHSSFYCIGNMGPYRSSSHGYKLDTNQYNALRFVGETGGTLAFSGRFTLYGLST